MHLCDPLLYCQGGIGGPGLGQKLLTALKEVALEDEREGINSNLS